MINVKTHTTNDLIKPFNIMIVLTFIAFVLRIYNIDFNSIWLDEGATFSFSHPSKSFMDIWNITAAGEFNPPLFHWIEHYMLFFGQTEFILRLMPCVFGVLTIPVFYYIGKEIYSENLGLVSSFLLTISSFHIYYSQEARVYTLLLLIVSLFILFYLRFKKDKSIKWAIAMGSCASLGFWAHFWSLVVTIPFFLLMIFEALRNIKNKQEDIRKNIGVLIASAVAFVSTIPLTLIIYNLLIHRISTPSQWGRKDIELLIDYFSWIGYNNILMTISILLLIVFGFIIMYRLNSGLMKNFSIVMISVIVISVAISHTIPMLPRYMITLFPIIYTTMALTIMSLYANYRKIFYVFLIALLISAGISLNTYYTTYTREYWKGYAQELYNKTNSGDVIIVLPDYMRLALDFYYDNKTDDTIEYGVYNQVDDLIKLTPPNKRTIYLFTWDISATDPNLSTVKWIEANAKNKGTYYGITTFVREPVI